MDIKHLLHNLHFRRDFQHKQIAWLLDVPRPTITRWFKAFDLPTKSCHRYTKQNLTSWLYKTGRLKKKIVDKGPDERLQRTKLNVNVNFFKYWNPEMAYILGFFAADGGMFVNSGGSKYIQFTSTDMEILIKIKKMMQSNHKIGIKKKSPSCKGKKICYLIQIGSKEMFEDLLKLGFTPKKDIKLKFPNVPNQYLNHFVRGYFDGDGCISTGTYERKARKNKITFFMVACFVSGTKDFLNTLSRELHTSANMGKGSLRRKGNDNAYQLSFSEKDSKKLFRYMYKDVHNKIDYYLERKYNKFLKAFELSGDVA